MAILGYLAAFFAGAMFGIMLIALVSINDKDK